MAMNHPTLRPFAAVAAALLLLPVMGCKTYTSGLSATTASGSSAAASYDEAMAMWTNDRGSKEGLQKIISTLEAVIAAEPNQQDALTLLSRSYYLMADGYTNVPAEPADDYAKRLVAAKAPLFEAGTTYGERAMAVDAAFKAQIDKGTKAADAVTALQLDDQMAIYWTAANLGKWARSQGFATLVKYKGYIAKMMTHCLALDETAFYAGPVRYWGAFYAVAPGFAGGDMTKSKEYFERAKEMNPEYFGTYVLYADAYAEKAQDRALFKSLLEHVINTPSDVLPEMIPEQNIEKAKAKAFLEQIDELFAE
ncbi:MAG: hypothetical protein CMP23_02490 [Rickettsiales bacterium]|nr:hypothetical protein [Rickettsiales bacterium]|tara:strand:- start:422 stop:1348 length:927 start_codon:yes stop_codon:yes gene_type:complete